MVVALMCVRLFRATLLTLLFATSAIVVRGDSPLATNATPDDQRSAIVGATQNYGVRLRKLHLVRPDLVPYPLSLEVYC
jgi:hypothetical protein